MLRVNGEPVSQEAIRLEFNRLAAFYTEHQPQADLEAVRPTLMEKAREQAIGAVLLMQEAQRRGIDVAPEQVETKFREMIDASGGKEAFMRMVTRKDMDLDALRVAIARGLQVDELVRRVVADEPDPTDQDIQAYYDANRQALMTPEKVRARHILLTTTGDPSATDRAVAETRLQSLADEVRQGADFAELAKLHSDCPSGREAGGMIGWIGRGTVLPAIEQAVFALAADGDVSDPVETPLGLHVFQRVGGRPGRPATFDESRDRIAELLRHTRRGARLSAFVTNLQAEAEIDTEPDEAGTD